MEKELQKFYFQKSSKKLLFFFPSEINFCLRARKSKLKSHVPPPPKAQFLLGFHPRWLEVWVSLAQFGPWRMPGCRVSAPGALDYGRVGAACPSFYLPTLSGLSSWAVVGGGEGGKN